MTQHICLSKTDDLINWYWEQSDLIFPGSIDEDGICQCGTEKLIEHSDKPNQMRTFLMIASFFDQMIYTHFREDYSRFRKRYHFPKVFSHPSIVGMASPSWLVYSYYGYDKKMDWNAAQPIALQLFTECLEYLATTGRNQGLLYDFLDMAEKETHLEFEPAAAQEILAILECVDVSDD